MVDQQKGRPGDEDSGWQLSVKRGANGRDGQLDTSTAGLGQRFEVRKALRHGANRSMLRV